MSDNEASPEPQDAENPVVDTPEGDTEDGTQEAMSQEEVAEVEPDNEGNEAEQAEPGPDNDEEAADEENDGDGDQMPESDSAEPEAPDQPGEPEAPDQPGEPEAPDQPGEPEAPDQEEQEAEMAEESVSEPPEPEEELQNGTNGNVQISDAGDKQTGKRPGMSTLAELVDPDRLQSILADLRSDVAGVARTSWVILGHVDNNPNQVDILGEDTGAEASLDGFRGHLAEDQVMYGIIRLTSTVDMSCTVKFVYVHWIGEEIPFAKRGRFGVVHGSVEKHFNPYHLLIETGNMDDLSEESIVQRLDESSGTKNNIIEGSVEGRQERGFLQHQSRPAGGNSFKSVAPDGTAVETSPELQEAIGEVRDDKCETTWVLSGYEGGNVKGALVLVEKGSGDISELVEQLIDDQVMYALYRITDRIDDIDTVKFAYIYWIGPDTKPIIKGKVSACTGPVEKVFSPAHVSLAFTNRYDIEEDVVRDKVMSSSGSKSHVM